MDIVSTNMISVISPNIMSTMLPNFYDQKVRCKMDCYILHTVLLVIKLLCITSIICYHYAKSTSKQKGIDALTRLMNQDWWIFKSLYEKPYVCGYDIIDIIKFKDFDSDNFLIDEKSYKNVLIYDASYKTLIWSKNFAY